MSSRSADLFTVFSTKSAMGFVLLPARVPGNRQTTIGSAFEDMGLAVSERPRWAMILEYKRYGQAFWAGAPMYPPGGLPG